MECIATSVWMRMVSDKNQINFDEKHSYKTEESIHVCHAGYISLFPFLLGLVSPDSAQLSKLLDLMTDPSRLWSPYGLRSLSLSHPLYGKDENYWRGPIWIQMNWLALKALKERYTVEAGPERERCVKMYEELRTNVVNNVFEEWRRTGYVWEQYDAGTGEGRRSHPFTGWTSLVTMSEFLSCFARRRPSASHMVGPQ
jgi:mannosyl-oligosaccharide glucosidase